MAEKYEVTSVGVNPADDRAHRMRVYFITMTVRVACVASLFFVRGWWVLVVGLGAVILPYFAVLVANAVAHGEGSRPDAPAPLELESAEQPEPESAAQAVIVVDAPAERRASGSAA